MTDVKKADIAGGDWNLCFVPRRDIGDAERESPFIATLSLNQGCLRAS